MLFKPTAHALEYHINLVPSVLSTVTRNVDRGFRNVTVQLLLLSKFSLGYPGGPNGNIRDRRIETPRPLSFRWLKRFLARTNETEKLDIVTQDNAVQDFEIYTTSNQ